MATFANIIRQLGNWFDAGAVGTPAQADELGNMKATSLDALSAAAFPVGASTATSVAVGKAGTANGNGVRNAASRNIIENKPTAPVDIAGGVTATVTQLLEAGIFLCSASATLTLPTAQGPSGIVQALPGAAVGDIISFVQVVAAAQTATLAAGTGSTLAGIATTAAAATGRRWYGRITAITAGSETITWY